jgi:hypothetical protein
VLAALGALLAAFLLLPFALYGDYPGANARIIYGVVSLGAVERVELSIRELGQSQFPTRASRHYRFLFLQLCVGKNRLAPSLNAPLDQCGDCTDFASPTDPTPTYRYALPQKIAIAQSEFLRVFTFGSPRPVHLPAGRVAMRGQCS